MRPRRWTVLGFFLWAVVGFLVTFGFITVVGLPIVLVGLLLGTWLNRRAPGWPSDLGLVAGAGGMCLTIATLNAIDGAVDPTVWGVVGASLLAVSGLAFWRVQPR